nr:hypothetical protein [Cressdnaviricota sp.]
MNDRIIISNKTRLAIDNNPLRTFYIAPIIRCSLQIIMRSKMRFATSGYTI